jgi:hypothetical protein
MPGLRPFPFSVGERKLMRGEMFATILFAALPRCASAVNPVFQSLDAAGNGKALNERSFFDNVRTAYRCHYGPLKVH